MILDYNQSYNNNVNQNTVIINNQPVIKEKEYIIKYRPIYINKPQPKRYAKKLAAPICLLDYLWVYPEDLGAYESGPSSIIYEVNKKGHYGRNDWRVPTDEELRLMENYADKCGLGDGIYLSTTHCNGILRLVSSGLSVSEKNRQYEEYKKKCQAEQTLAEERRRKALELEEERRRSVHSQKLNEQNRLISSRSVFICNGILWSASNMGANVGNEKGVQYSNINLDENWRLPTEREFKEVIKQSTRGVGYISHNCGLKIPNGTYAVTMNDGTRGYIIVPSMMVNNHQIPTLIRLVQDKIY